MWCRFLETAHELGGDAERPRLSLSNSSTDQGGGKRRGEGIGEITTTGVFAGRDNAKFTAMSALPQKRTFGGAIR